jgi:hypothetical protein
MQYVAFPLGSDGLQEKLASQRLGIGEHESRLGAAFFDKPVRRSLVVESVGDDDVQHSQQLDLCGQQCIRRVHVRAMVEQERLPSDCRF